ncbi:MAG: putative molybdenum carrier protein [Myxococcota bacterium]|nr:putative molybdenum carrier protein [Myxococcota bacterium]
MLVIIHSGQTGVERGAHRAAVATSLAVAGFMPLDRRDELGPLPPDIADALTPCFERGPRPPVRANIALASGVLLVIPCAATPEKFAAMPAVLQGIRAARVPSLVCDSESDFEEVARWATSLPETCGSTRIMVTGPRGTRWNHGESVARRLVMSIRAYLPAPSQSPVAQPSHREER